MDAFFNLYIAEGRGEEREKSEGRRDLKETRVEFGLGFVDSLELILPFSAL